MKIQAFYATCENCAGNLKHGEKLWIFDKMYFCCEKCLMKYLYRHEIEEDQVEIVDEE